MITHSLVRLRTVNEQVGGVVAAVRAIMVGPLPVVVVGLVSDNHGPFAYRGGLYLSSALIGVAGGVALTRLPIFRRRNPTH